MHAGWIKTFALAALLAGAGFAFGQGGPGDAKKIDKPETRLPASEPLCSIWIGV